MELVKSLYDDEWVFRDPMLTEDVESKFDQALDAYDDGRCKRAETLIGSVVIECPNHIDALTTLGFTAKITGMLLAAMFSAKPPSPSGCKRFPRHSVGTAIASLGRNSPTGPFCAHTTRLASIAWSKMPGTTPSPSSQGSWRSIRTTIKGSGTYFPNAGSRRTIRPR